MHFMAIEVAAQRYLFSPKPKRKRGPTTFDKAFSAKLQKEVTKVPFSHNHLHDLESLWWVTAWVVFYHSFSKGTTPRDCPTLQDANDQLLLTAKLFPPVPASAARHDSFQIDGSFLEIHGELPKNKRDAHICLDLLREVLISHYEDVEAEYPLINSNASEDDIYDTFTKGFSTLKSKYHGVALKSIQDIRTELSKPKNKRPRSESTNDSGAAQKNRRK